MKKTAKIGIVIAFIIAIAGSFAAGSHMKEQEQIAERMQRCNTLISFTVDKAEKEDLSDPDTMEALISNVYAACEFCDQPDLSAQLYELWNTLIFEGDRYIGREDVLADQLRAISEAMKTEG